MNGKQIVIVIVALAVSVLIVRHELPIDFPLIIVKVLRIFVSLFVVLALTILACIFAGRRKKIS